MNPLALKSSIKNVKYNGSLIQLVHYYYYYFFYDSRFIVNCFEECARNVAEFFIKILEIVFNVRNISLFHTRKMAYFC